MKNLTKPVKKKNVGFIATRISGTDGVSLETMKWVNVFEKKNITCFFFAGELDTPPKKSYIAKKAHFSHSEIKDIFKHCFGIRVRGRFITDKIHTITQELKNHIYKFIELFDIDFLVAENCLTIPLNIPLGIALTEVISEVGLPVISHHHDFFWERQHFLINGIWEYLNMAFPPHIPSINHVVINSSGSNQLSLRTGISSTIIPNVMDFKNPPKPIDKYASDVREALGIQKDEFFILQPTRVVKRKGIEHAIELVHRINLKGLKAKLVISHASGDEGFSYEQRIKEYSKLMKVDTIFVSEIINEKRGWTKSGKKIYTLDDIYPHADLVTYPSTFEGFGNAFLEAIYFRIPIVVNIYSIYATDIKPKGFSVIELDGFVSEEAVIKTIEVLKNQKLREKIVNKNYEIANTYFSYKVLESKLNNLIPVFLK
jgi:glycosyltransferase involved in cell wall biosynthesis